MTNQKRICTATVATLSLLLSLPVIAQESAPTRILTFYVTSIRLASHICGDNDRGDTKKLVDCGLQFYVEGNIDNVQYAIQCTDDNSDGRCGKLHQGKEYLCYWESPLGTERERRGPESQDHLMLRFPLKKTATGEQPLPLLYYVVSEQEEEP